MGTLDVSELERADLSTAEKRLDVALDPASIHGESGSLDGAPPPSKDAPRLSFGNIPVTNFGNGQPTRPRFLRGWVDAFGHGDKLLVGEDARLLDRHEPKAPDDDTAGTAFGRAILDDEALEARRHDLDAEASQLPIPEKCSRTLTPTSEGSGAFKASTTRFVSFSLAMSATYRNIA